jgi:hypothetical protein
MEVSIYILDKFSIFLLHYINLLNERIEHKLAIFDGLKLLVQQKFSFILVLKMLTLVMLNYEVLNFIQLGKNVLFQFIIFSADLFHLNIEFQISKILANI